MVANFPKFDFSASNFPMSTFLAEKFLMTNFSTKKLLKLDFIKIFQSSNFPKFPKENFDKFLGGFDKVLTENDDKFRKES